MIVSMGVCRIHQKFVPFHSYEGDKPYIFISYSHKDSKLVFNIIGELRRQGFRIWYDEGIDPGTEWPEEIAAHLKNSSAVLLFVSPDSVQSHNVRREINFAIENQKRLFCVYLTPTELTPGMQMQMSLIQSIHYTYPDTADFYVRLNKVLSQAMGVPDTEHSGSPEFAPSPSLWAARKPAIIIGIVAALALIPISVFWVSRGMSQKTQDTLSSVSTSSFVASHSEPSSASSVASHSELSSAIEPISAEESATDNVPSESVSQTELATFIHSFYGHEVAFPLEFKDQLVFKEGIDSQGDSYAQVFYKPIHDKNAKSGEIMYMDLWTRDYYDPYIKNWYNKCVSQGKFTDPIPGQTPISYKPDTILVAMFDHYNANGSTAQEKTDYTKLVSTMQIYCQDMQAKTLPQDQPYYDSYLKEWWEGAQN